MKEENETIIKALNMYGRVPKQWELLNEIERLNKENEELKKMCEIYSKSLYNSDLKKAEDRIHKAIEYIEKHSSGIITANEGIVYVVPSGNILNILKGVDKE